MTDAAAGAGGRSGIEQAAILLLSRGEKEAADVLKHLSARDVQRLGAAMAQVANVSRAEVMSVIGEDKATGLIDRILLGHSSKGLEQLKWMESRAIAEMVRFEHPQIVAIIRAYLEADQSAEVISQLPENVRAEVLMRIATLDGIQPAALRELDQIMERQFARNSQARSSALGAPKYPVDIVDLLEPRIENAVTEEINKIDEVLGAKIEDLIFVFDNLVDVDDRGMQELFSQVPCDTLLLALKADDERLKDKIFKNISQRAAEMLTDDLASRDLVKLLEVKAAQREILAVARKLSQVGTSSLGAKGGGAYV